MNRLFILCIFMVTIPLGGFGQVGEKVSSVKILNVDNDIVSIPFLGEKNLLIFYVDPGRPRQNHTFRDYFKTHPINSPNIVSYGIINLAAAPLLSNSLIRKKAIREAGKVNGKIYFDPDNALADGWNLPNADKNFAILFVSKQRVIEFYKAGKLTPGEQTNVLDLIEKYR